MSQKDIYKSVLWLLLASIFVACKVQEYSGKQKGDDCEGDVPIVAFMNYSVWKVNDEVGYRIQLEKKILTEGYVKERDFECAQFPGKIEFRILDNENKELKLGCFDNPLLKTVEFVDENGMLCKKDLELDSAVFMLRIPLPCGARYISLEKHNEEALESSILSFVDLLNEE